MREAVIVDAVRTPSGRGKPGGALSSWHPVELLAETLQALIGRTGIDPQRVDDVIAGCVSQAGEQAANIARNAWLAAGLPESVPATTIDRQCGSSQQAAHFAAQGIIAGAYDVVVVGGVESMSRVPMFAAAGDADPYGRLLNQRYAPGLVQQGISAELIAARWGFDRDALDAFAAESHRRAAEATADGRFLAEVLPVKTTVGDEPFLLSVDETIRPGTTPEALARLAPSFVDEQVHRRFPQIAWHITPGNASPLTDGAAALLVMERGLAEQLGLRPRAAFRHFHVAGDDPLLMLTGPIAATERVLERARLSIDDIDAFEVNEAFAPVVLAWSRETGGDLERTNINGGAIALGHPLGASGARLMTTLVHVLEQTGGRFGLQTMCEGGGMANATIIERLEG